jgi:hypothetical protein
MNHEVGLDEAGRIPCLKPKNGPSEKRSEEHAPIWTDHNCDDYSGTRRIVSKIRSVQSASIGRRYAPRIVLKGNCQVITSVSAGVPESIRLFRGLHFHLL